MTPSVVNGAGDSKGGEPYPRQLAVARQVSVTQFVLLGTESVHRHVHTSCPAVAFTIVSFGEFLSAGDVHLPDSLVDFFFGE